MALSSKSILYFGSTDFVYCYRVPQYSVTVARVETTPLNSIDFCNKDRTNAIELFTTTALYVMWFVFG